MQFREFSNWRQEERFLSVPARRGVFRIQFPKGPPYIGRTANLRQRFRRLLGPVTSSRRRLSLRSIAQSAHYRLTGSAFESDLALYTAARLHRPEEARDYLKLRPSFFVKILLGNRFPRTCLTKRLTRSRALFYGPFPSRHSADQFQQAFLDLFLVRRCIENLQPSPDHPGCIWGEINLCLRPCQAACDDGAYLEEVQRMAMFLASDGQSLLEEARAARDRSSEELDFEAAGEHHKTWTKAREALKLRGPLSRELNKQCGLMLQTSADKSCVELTPLHMGSLQASFRLPCDAQSRPARLGSAIRRELAAKDWRECSPQQKSDHLSLLQRWQGSSFRKGEFVAFDDLWAPPARKLGHAALRVFTGAKPSKAKGRTSRSAAAKEYAQRDSLFPR